MSGTNIKLYKDDKLILDCTLCTNPEGRIGWWDAVDGTFHDETENILKQAYIEKTGTQWIDTGVLPQWISVEERLPDKGFLDKEIIVCKLNRFGGQYVYVTRFWGTHSALWNNITHWMPLPEPPKEKK